MAEGPRISRRILLKRGVGLVLTAGCSTIGLAERGQADGPPPRGSVLASEHELLASEFAYVSPLLADGRESRCHGEVWYGWLDGSVVVITARSTWKARALARGLDRARVWIGNHGRWKGWFRNNEDFRRAPHFDARAERERDPAVLDRLMAVYAKKYPAEFSAWEEKQRSGFESGERILIRYSMADAPASTFPHPSD